MGCRTEGVGFRVPGLIEFLREKLLVPAQGDSIHLSTRVNLVGHQVGTILCRELEHCVEQNLAIRCSLSQQGTFRLTQGFDTVC